MPLIHGWGGGGQALGKNIEQKFSQHDMGVVEKFCLFLLTYSWVRFLAVPSVKSY